MHRNLAFKTDHSTNRRSSPATDCNPNKRIAAAEVRQLCGGVSDMTLWRWLADGSLSFPRPIYIARRRYWREADVITWLEAQESAS